MPPGLYEIGRKCDKCIGRLSQTCPYSADLLRLNFPTGKLTARFRIVNLQEKPLADLEIKLRELYNQYKTKADAGCAEAKRIVEHLKTFYKNTYDIDL